MKLPSLMNSLRSLIDDVTAPYLWEDDELRAYINEAEREAARRSRLILDKSTVSVTDISVVSGTSTYSLDSRVWGILRAKLDSEPRPLIKKPRQYFDSINNWESVTGTPIAYFRDRYTITLYPEPVAADTLSLDVIRLPLADMDTADDEPEIPSHLHYQLIYWAAHLAFLKHDAETFDERAAMRNADLFARHFGPPISANTEAAWQNHTQSHVSPLGATL